MKFSREDLIRTDNARVSSIGFATGKASSWHHHTCVHEYVFCLHGTVEIRLSAPAGHCRLRPGERCNIEPGRPHRVPNSGGGGAGYLLVQHGDYDYVQGEP